MIKIYAFFTCLPLLFVIIKIKRRSDLNAYDITLAFQTLYFGLIPLMSDPLDIEYPIVQNDVGVQFSASLYFGLFASTLVLLSRVYDKRYKNKYKLLNVTFTIRNWILKNQMSPKGGLILMYILVVLMFFRPFSSVVSAEELALSNLDAKRDLIAQNNTPLAILLGDFYQYMRPVVAFILASFIIRGYQKNIWFYLLCGLIFLFFMTSSRTFLFEFILFFVLVFYSCKKHTIKREQIIKWGVIMVLVITIFFPIISATRYVRLIYSVHGQSNLSFYEMARESINLVVNANDLKEKFDNKDSRRWYVYQIYALATESDYQGYGELTMKAISFGMPRALYPNKDMGGSQATIEKQLHVYNDVADTLLLYGMMECKNISFIISILVFELLFYVHEKLFFVMSAIFRSAWIQMFIISCLFIRLNQVEWSVDSFIPTFIHIIICCFLIQVIVFVVNIISPLRTTK